MTGAGERALAYAAAGWPVFPCKPGSKEPDTPHGCKDATTGQGRICAWWHARPLRNVAVATGAPGPDVLDVNVKNGGSGWAAFNRLKAAGYLAGAVAIVRTPSGGLHVYFTGTGQPNGRLPRHYLDFRGRGGYVLAPPSAVDGKPYEVLDHRSGSADLDWQAVRNLLDPPPATAPARPPRGGDISHLAGWVASQPEGNRNDGLYWAARRAIESGLDAAALVAAAVQSGLTEAEARRTVASATRGSRPVKLADLDVTLGGAAVLGDVHTVLTRYVVFPSPEAADATALFAAATHAAAHLEFASRLVIRSPVKRCGKRRLEDVLAGLVHMPLLTANISAASLVHSINEDDPPTIMLDEADATFGKALKGDERSEHLRGILNAGFGRDRPYIRYDVAQRRNVPTPTFAMAVIAGIGSMPDTIEDRAVAFTMRRKAPGETVSKYRIRRDKPKVLEVGERLGAWIDTVAKDLGAAEPDMPAGLNDRAEDVWESLLAVADAAGGTWPARARKAARVLSDEAEEDAADGMRLLADLRDVFAAQDKLWTQTILAALHGIAEAPWGDWYGRQLTDRELAKLLKPYGIRSRDVKIDGVNHKGYYREQFTESWRSYAGGASATSATSATAQVNGQIASATDALPMGYPPEPVADGSPRVADAKPALNGEVAQVAPVADDPPVCKRCGEAHHRYGDNGRPCRKPVEARP